MGAYFVQPQRFTVVTSNEVATAKATNLNTDQPGLVFRSNGVTASVVTQVPGLPIDTVALTGNNLRAGDQMRVRGSASSDMSNPLFDVTVLGWSGVTPKAGAFTIANLGGTFAPAFVRVDVGATGIPAGYVQASRLVIGKALRCGGVEIGAKKGWQDGSSISEALGSTIIDPQRVRDTWKVGVSCVNRTDYYTNWEPFYRWAGNKNAFLFVPDDDPLIVQNSACFGRLQPSGASEADSWDQFSFDLNIIEV